MWNRQKGLAPLATATSRLIEGYQWLVSPVLPPACRFIPSCSEYARKVLRTHGFVRGLILAARRLGRCHPFHPGGYDPPPHPRHPPPF